MSNYVCPEHKAPVSWKGTGCPQCEHDRRFGRQRSHGDPTLTGEGWERWRVDHAAVHTLEVPQ